MVEPRKRAPSFGIPKKFTDGEWDRMLVAFREHPGDTTLVAELTGIKRARVVRAWHHGYPRQGRPAISELLEADKYLARAQRAEAHDAERAGPSPSPPPEPPPRQRRPEPEPAPVPPGGLEAGATVVLNEENKRVMASMMERDRQRRKALEDSSRTRAEEGKLIALSRRNVMQLGVSTARVLRGAEQLAARMETQLAKAEDIPLKDAMVMLQRASVIVRLGTEAGKMAVQMERLVMGQPIGDGTEVAAGGKLSPEEAERWIETTMRALERSKMRQRDSREDDATTSSPPPAAPGPLRLPASTGAAEPAALDAAAFARGGRAVVDAN